MIARRNLLRSSAAVALAATATSTGDAAADKASPSTFVLVHGAWHGGWCWAPVADRLRTSGAHVFTPTLTGLGERYHLRGANVGLDTHIDDIVAVLECEELRDVVLVGHSYGGLVIESVIDRARDRIRRSIFLDAVLLDDGQSLAILAAPAQIEQMRAKAIEGIGMPAPPAGPAFGITDAEQARHVERRLVPHPIKSFTDTVAWKNGGVANTPALYVQCTAPKFSGSDRSRELATKRGWRVTTLATGHDAMVSDPVATAKLLLRDASVRTKI